MLVDVILVVVICGVRLRHGAAAEDIELCTCNIIADGQMTQERDLPNSTLLQSPTARILRRLSNPTALGFFHICTLYITFETTRIHHLLPSAMLARHMLKLPKFGKFGIMSRWSPAQ